MPEENDYMEKQAWECPRCKKINAPHIDQCKCEKQFAPVDRIDLDEDIRETLKAFEEGRLETIPYFKDGVD
jgi:hypothetical protein